LRAQAAQPRTPVQEMAPVVQSLKQNLAVVHMTMPSVAVTNSTVAQVDIAAV